MACVSLGLGIGASTAAFSVVHGVLFRPLPVADPGSLAVVSAGSTSFQYSMSYPAYTYLRDHASMVDGLVAFRAQPLTVSAGGGATERVSGMLVSGNYFDVLGIRMMAGSPIRPEDDEVEGIGGRRGLVAVVSWRYWQRRLNAVAIGSTIRINGQPATIVGIAPEGFGGTRVGSLPDVFVPMMFATRVFSGPNWLTTPQNNWIRLLARVRAGTNISQAQAGMTSAFRQFNQDIVLPLTRSDSARQSVSTRTIRLEPGQSGLLELGDVRPALFALTGLVSLVLLMACVNVASLMVARAEHRHRQTAISIALGATRAHLWRESAIESLVIGAGGVGLGLVIAAWMRGLLLQVVPGRQELDVTLDMRVFGVSIFCGLVTAAVLAFVTARQTMRVGVVDTLKGTDLAARLWLRKGLIIAQLALSVLVLAATSLFVRTLTSLGGVDPGFDREHVLIASTATDGYTTEQRDAFDAQLLQEVRALPGVVAAALANDEPLRVRTGWIVTVWPDPAAPPQQVDVSVAFVSPDYFKTMGMRMLGGREFDERDRSSVSTPIVVNERFAKRYLPPGIAPVGTSFVGNGGTVFQIIGVVANSASIGLRDLDQHMLYVPGGRGVLHVRSAVPPATLVGVVRAAVERIDPHVPVFDVRTIGEQMDLAIGRERMFASLSVTFAAQALLLSSLGLFGVMASAVSRRTKELGIRLALGAAPSILVRSVLREAAALAACGALLGLPAAWLMARAIRGLFFGIGANDWVSLAFAMAVLAAVAAAAAWIPARRASRVDPLIALRSE